MSLPGLLLALCTLAWFPAAAVAQGVPVPYADSFESPSWPGPEWTLTYSAPAVGRIQALIPSPASPDGGRTVNFDVSTASSVCTNELTIAVDLAAAPAATLKYWAKETQDETDLEDGLFLNDGIGATWFKVVDHATLTASWIEITVNLANAAAAHGLAVTSNFKIRFSQRDNFPAPTDGLQIDGVRIFEPPNGQPNTAVASMEVNAGVNAAGAPASIGIQGPFFAAVLPGGPLTFSVQGAPNQPFILAAGPLNENNAFIPGSGSLDLGLLGIADLSDIVIVLDGSAPGFLNALANTGPSGESTLSFFVPQLPSGPWIAFQAGILNATTLSLTAATQITVL